MPPAPAVTGLARDVTLVLTLLVASSTATPMVCSAAGTDGQVVLGAAVGADDALCVMDVQFLEGHRLFLSQFFQSRRHFSSQANDRSTTHRFGSTTKVCSSLRFTTSTAAPNRLCTAAAKGFPV